MACSTRKFRPSPKLLLCLMLSCTITIVYQVRNTILNGEQNDINNFMEGQVSDDLVMRRELWADLMKKVKRKKKFKRVPDIIGIGMRKCGTGMLENFIAQHPLVAVNLSEVHYYDNNLEKGLEYYKNLLPFVTEDQLVMEKTPAIFTSLPFELPDIIMRDSPDVKLILMLCDPVNRAFSDYWMRVRHGGKNASNKTFEQYVDEYLPRVQTLFNTVRMADEDEADKLEYVLKSLQKNRCTFSFGHGIYAYFIKRWLEAIPPDQLLIVNGEDFLNDPGPVIERLQEYLGIPKLIRKGDFVRHPDSGLFCLRRWWFSGNEYGQESQYLYNKGGSESGLLCSREGKGLTRSRNTKYILRDETANKLGHFFEPYNEILYSILGRNFHW